MHGTTIYTVIAKVVFMDIRNLLLGEESWGFLFSPALTIGGGTTQVLSNIIGESILGLPRD